MNSSSSSSSLPPPSNKKESELFGVMFATIPAVLAYFIGWEYLYYYLGQFGVGIAELELGLETIFIYAVPPISWMIKSYWPFTVGAIGLAAIASRFCPVSIRLIILKW